MKNENNLYDDERFGVYNAFIDINEIKPKTLTTTQITILSVIWRSINNQMDNPLRGTAWISQETIRTKSGISSNTTYYKHFKALIDEGWIIETRRINDTNLYELRIPKDIYNVLCTETDNTVCTETDNTVCTETDNTVCTETDNTVCTETVQLKDNIKENIKDKNKRKIEVANAPSSPFGDFDFVFNLLQKLKLKETDKNIQLITNKIKNKDSIVQIEKIINEDCYDWVNKKEYNSDSHKINTALKFIINEADKRYFHINPPKDNKLYYGRYTKEEVDNFRLNLSMGEMYPELLEFIQIEQNYNSF